MKEEQSVKRFYTCACYTRLLFTLIWLNVYYVFTLSLSTMYISVMNITVSKYDKRGEHDVNE